MKLRVSCETWRRFAFGVMVGAFAVFLIGVAGVAESDFLGTTKIADFLGAEDIRETAMTYLDVALLGVVSFLYADYYSVLRKAQEIVNRQNTRLDNYTRFVADMTELMEREFRELHRKVNCCASDGKKNFNRALFKAGVLDVERAKRSYTTPYNFACEAWRDASKYRKEVCKSALWITALNLLSALNGAAFLAEALEGTVSGALFQGFSALFCAFCACLETVNLRRRWDMLRWCTMDFNDWANVLKRAVESEISEEVEHESF